MTIDGSQGEGGGQILRTALALSLVTGTPFSIEKIRAGRRKPGLLRQHLTAVNAAVAVGGADVDGATLGSQTLVFRPRGVNPGEYRFAIGTAGSTGLVIQTVLPALLTASGPSALTLEGGTHNPAAPPFDFLARAFLPLIERMGPRVATVLECPGFYPAGGGRCTVRITPSARLEPLTLLERGEIKQRRARALVAHLPRQIADRELAVVRNRLGWSDDDIHAHDIVVQQHEGTLEVESEHLTEIFCGFGEVGIRAESIAEHASKEARRYLAAGVPVGMHLADQLLVPLALAGAGSFRTIGLSSHSRTNLDVIRLFSSTRITASGDRDDVLVEFGG